jgi:rRNA maturation endonuclease Nob1
MINDNCPSCGTSNYPTSISVASGDDFGGLCFDMKDNYNNIKNVDNFELQVKCSGCNGVDIPLRLISVQECDSCGCYNGKLKNYNIDSNIVSCVLICSSCGSNSISMKLKKNESKFRKLFSSFKP